MSQQQQRQVSLNEIYARIGQKDVELYLATTTYEATVAAQAQRIRELEKQVAEMTEQLAKKSTKADKAKE